MSCQWESCIDDYVDGELSPERRASLDRHLAGCASCRDAVAEVRGLLERAATLPREIGPARDLYPEIRERLRPETTAPGAAPPRARRAWLLVAASVVAVVGLASLRLLDDRAAPVRGVGPSVSPAAARPAAEPGVAETPVDAAVAEYVQAAELLQAAIEERHGRLAPETVAILEKNLAIVDRAIEEVRSAMEADPRARHNTRMLRAMHEQKIELLKKFNRLAS